MLTPDNMEPPDGVEPSRPAFVGPAHNPYAGVKTLNLVGRVGLEPTMVGLKGRCLSTLACNP